MSDKISRMEGDYHFPGNVTFAAVELPDNAIKDADVSPNANISPSKLGRRISAKVSQGNVAATTETRMLHVANAAGSAIGVKAGDIARATGAATVTFNVRKNGVSILTGVTTLDSTHPAGATYGYVSGALDGALVDYVAGDVFDVVITATAGGGGLPTGAWVELLLDEDPI